MPCIPFPKFVRRAPWFPGASVGLLHTTGFVSSPIPSITMRTTEPGLRWRGGSKPDPTPERRNHKDQQTSMKRTQQRGAAHPVTCRCACGNDGPWEQAHPSRNSLNERGDVEEQLGGPPVLCGQTDEAGGQILFTLNHDSKVRPKGL